MAELSRVEPCYSFMANSEIQTGTDTSKDGTRTGSTGSMKEDMLSEASQDHYNCPKDRFLRDLDL